MSACFGDDSVVIATMWTRPGLVTGRRKCRLYSGISRAALFFRFAGTRSTATLLFMASGSA